MTVRAEGIRKARRSVDGPRLWARQVRVLVALDLSKRAADRRSWWVLALAAAPVLLMGVASLNLSRPYGYDRSMAEAIDGYAAMFEPLYLRAIVFLGCVGVFTSLFRAEVLAGSLHYYLLAPVRREVLVVGKFAAGLLVSVPLFGLSALGALALSYVPFLPPGSDIGSALALLADHGAGYLVAVALACLGYGAVFLLTGLRFRNPIVPAALILGWEYVNFLLPPVLKQFSVIHYLRSFLPVSPHVGPFAMLAEPVPVWHAAAGLLLFTGLMLLGSMLSIRRLEIDYTKD